MESLSSNTVLMTLVAASAVSCGLALLAWMLEKSPRAWRPERLIYGLWILVLFRLILIFVPASPFSILNYCASELKSLSFEQRAVDSSDRLGFQRAESVAPVSYSMTGFENRTDLSMNLLGPIVGATLLSVWALGLVLLIRQLVRNLREVREIVDRAQAIPITQTFDRLSKTIRVANTRKRVNLALTTDLAVPAVVGIFRPTVLIPRWCEQELTAEQLELVVTHELVHVGRHDLLLQFLAHLIRIVHWFNPLVYLATARLAHWQEIDCDRQVLNILQGDRDRRKLYGDTLLQIFTRAASEPTRPNLVPGFIGAINVRRHSNVCNLIERIQMLQQPTFRSQKSTLLTGLALTLLLAVGFTSAQESPTTAMEEPKSADKQENLNSRVAIKLTIYSGTSAEVSSIMDKLKSGIDLDESAPVIDLGLPKSEHQQKFHTLIKDLNIMCAPQIITRYELAAELTQGREFPRLDENGETQFAFVGHQVKVTPYQKNGKSILQVSWKQSDVNLEKTIEMVMPDGSQASIPQMSLTEIKTTLDIPPTNAAVIMCPSGSVEGKQSLIKIECTDLDDQTTAQSPAAEIKLLR